MKITDFKKGDLITRVGTSDVYTPEPKYELDPFIFSEISHGKIWLVHLNENKDYTPEIFSEVLDQRKDDDWEYYVIPELIRDLVLKNLRNSNIRICNLLRDYLVKNKTHQYHSTV